MNVRSLKIPLPFFCGAIGVVNNGVKELAHDSIVHMNQALTFMDELKQAMGMNGPPFFMFSSFYGKFTFIIDNRIVIVTIGSQLVMVFF